MYAEFEVLVMEQPACIRTDSTTYLVVVECACGRRGCGRSRNVRMDTITERPYYPKDLVVTSELGLKRRLYHVIGRDVKGIVGLVVIKAAKCTGIADHEIAQVAVCSQ